MEKRSRLGRGLSSLLSTDIHTIRAEIPPPAMPDTPAAQQIPPADYEADYEMFHVEHAKIIRNENQPRRQFDESELATLAESIRQAGIIQPIIVRKLGDQFEVIAGERRLRAAILAGLVKIPVIVRSVEPVEQAQIALIENIHRQDLNPIERANAYRQLLNNEGLTHQELATRLGEDRSVISNHLRLLELDSSVQKLLLDSSLSLGHAKLLAGIQNPAEQQRLANHVVANQLSVRQLETQLTALPSPNKLAKSKNAHLADLERQLSRDLQMRTEVKQTGKAGKGRLVIHYGSLDQFDQILARLDIKIHD